VPYERLAWNGHGTGLDSYHAWLAKKQTKVAMSSRRRRRGAGLQGWEKRSDQTVWSNSIKSGLKGCVTKLAAVCRLHRRRAGFCCSEFLFLSTFRAKFCSYWNLGFASWANFKQNWLTQSDAADVAVVRERCHL
jgi:hypothetical protein